jgi:hypothetical protein
VKRVDELRDLAFARSHVRQRNSKSPLVNRDRHSTIMTAGCDSYGADDVAV